VLQSVSSFVSYFEGIRRRTLNYIKAVPQDRLDWSPREGEFTCRQIILHLAITEKLFVGGFIDGKWKYGDSNAGGGSLDEVIDYLNRTHTESMAALSAIGDGELNQPRPTLDGPTIKAWRLLMMLVEHEVHHRSQLAMYLFLMGVQPPHIFGMGIEDVIARATG